MTDLRVSWRDFHYAVQNERDDRILDHHFEYEVKSVRLVYDYRTSADHRSVCALSERMVLLLVVQAKSLETLLVERAHDQVLSVHVFDQDTLHFDFYLALELP